MNGALAENLSHASDAARFAIKPMILRLKSDGAPATWLRRCDAEARDGTRLPGCVKLYIPNLRATVGSAPVTPSANLVFSYYDPAADIAWFPTGQSDDVVSKRVPDGLREYDRATRRLVAIEVWDASTRLPASLLAALPAPSAAKSAAARAGCFPPV